MSGRRLLALRALEVRATADNSSTRVEVETFGPVELLGDEVRQLVEVLHGYDPRTRDSADRIDELEHALAAAEDERDEHQARANDLERQLAAALGDIERHRTALHLADERTRAAEQLAEAATAKLGEVEQQRNGYRADVERMRAAFTPTGVHR